MRARARPPQAAAAAAARPAAAAAAEASMASADLQAAMAMAGVNLEDVCVDAAASRRKQDDLYASLRRMGHELEAGWSAIVSIRRAGNSAGTKVRLREGERELALPPPRRRLPAPSAPPPSTVAASAESRRRGSRPAHPLAPPPSPRNAIRRRTPTTGARRASGSGPRRRWRRSLAWLQVRSLASRLSQQEQHPPWRLIGHPRSPDGGLGCKELLHWQRARDPGRGCDQQFPARPARPHHQC